MPPRDGRAPPRSFFPRMGASQVYQIFYDAVSRSMLDPGFLPLDNTLGQRPDWYEFWVIREFLHTHQLEEDTWYGFLSSSFTEKTSLTSRHVHDFLGMAGHQGDVALMLCPWDQVAYFENPFEQGELWHPGITALTQAILDRLGVAVDLSTMVTHSSNFTYCNFVIAKAPYWREWLALADPFFALAENGAGEIGNRLTVNTSYGNRGGQAPMKAFIQERLPAIILQQRKFRVATFNTSESFPIYDELFMVDANTRGALQTCDLLKRRYGETGDPRYVELFREVRTLVKTKHVPSSDTSARLAAGALPPQRSRRLST